MDLQDYREQIDNIDTAILCLLKMRMGVSLEIGRYKKEHGLPVLDAEREKQKLAKIGESAGEEMRPYSDRLFSLLFELSRDHQETAHGSI